MFRTIDPEVAGELGKNTIMDTSVHPPIIHELHYNFEGWLGDDILTSFPCYIVSKRLKKEIESSKLSGIEFSSATITMDEQFFSSFPFDEFPDFFWARINGEFLVSDFSISPQYDLVVSEKAFGLLRKFNISNAIVENISSD